MELEAMDAVSGARHGRWQILANSTATAGQEHLLTAKRRGTREEKPWNPPMTFTSVQENDCAPVQEPPPIDRRLSIQGSAGPLAGRAAESTFK